MKSEDLIAQKQQAATGLTKWKKKLSMLDDAEKETQ